MNRFVEFLAATPDSRLAFRRLTAQFESDIVALSGDEPARLQLLNRLASEQLTTRLVETFSLHLKDFQAAYPGDVDAVALRTALDKWSLSVGQVAERSPDALLHQNPVWHQPLIRRDDDRYFLPIPQIIQSFCLPLFEHLFNGSDALLSNFQRLRGEALEGLLSEMLAHALPGGVPVVSAAKTTDMAAKLLKLQGAAR